MAVEVRQLVIKSSIGDERKPGAEVKDKEGPPPAEDLAQLKQDLLADCKSWLMEKLEDARER
jgi:hypothetical protein